MLIIYILIAISALFLQSIVFVALFKNNSIDSILNRTIIGSQWLIALYILIHTCLLWNDPHLLENNLMCNLSGFVFTYLEGVAVLTLFLIFTNPVKVILLRQAPFSRDFILGLLLATVILQFGFSTQILWFYPATQYRPVGTHTICWVDSINDRGYITVTWFIWSISILTLLVIVFIPTVTWLIWKTIEEEQKNRLDKDDRIRKLQWMITKKGLYLAVNTWLGLAMGAVMLIQEYVEMKVWPWPWHNIQEIVMGISWLLNPIIIYYSDQQVRSTIKVWVEGMWVSSFRYQSRDTSREGSTTATNPLSESFSFAESIVRK